jgi:hypothetical protein
MDVRVGHRQVVLEYLARMTGGVEKLPDRVKALVLDHKLTLLYLIKVAYYY